MFGRAGGRLKKCLLVIAFWLCIQHISSRQQPPTRRHPMAGQNTCQRGCRRARLRIFEEQGEKREKSQSFLKIDPPYFKSGFSGPDGAAAAATSAASVRAPPFSYSWYCRAIVSNHSPGSAFDRENGNRDHINGFAFSKDGCSCLDTEREKGRAMLSHAHDAHDAHGVSDAHDAHTHHHNFDGWIIFREIFDNVFN